MSTYFTKYVRRSLSLVAISREIPFLLCPNFRRVLISRLVGKASLFFFCFHTWHYDSFRVTLQEKLLLHFVLSREDALLELLSLREMHDDYILYIRSIFYDNFERKLILMRRKLLTICSNLVKNLKNFIYLELID